MRTPAAWLTISPAGGRIVGLNDPRDSLGLGFSAVPLYTEEDLMAKKPKSVPAPAFPFNEFLVVVGYNRSLAKYRGTPLGDPDRHVMFGRVSADMAMDPPDPPLTDQEMQPVAFAAKMALAKVMSARKRKKK